jgi:hypothetical protein
MVKRRPLRQDLDVTFHDGAPSGAVTIPINTPAEGVQPSFLIRKSC